MKTLIVILLGATIAHAQTINIHISPSFMLEWKEQTPNQVGYYEVWWNTGLEAPATDKDWGTRFSTTASYAELRGFEKWGTCEHPDPRDRVWFIIVTRDKAGKELRRTKPTFHTI